jgi:hypothetical protein
VHALRIDDELWSVALAKAKSEGRTLTRVINDSLAAYVAAGHGPPPPPGIVHEAIVPFEGESSRQRRNRVAKTGIAKEPQPPERDAACRHPRVLKGWCNDCKTGGHL